MTTIAAAGAAVRTMAAAIAAAITIISKGGIEFRYHCIIQCLQDVGPAGDGRVGRPFFFHISTGRGMV